MTDEPIAVLDASKFASDVISIPTIKNKYSDEQVGTYEVTDKNCLRCGSKLHRLILQNDYFNMIFRIINKPDFKCEMQFHFCLNKECGRVELVKENEGESP